MTSQHLKGYIAIMLAQCLVPHSHAQHWRQALGAFHAGFFDTQNVHLHGACMQRGKCASTIGPELAYLEHEGVLVGSACIHEPAQGLAPSQPAPSRPLHFALHAHQAAVRNLPDVAMVLR